MLHHLVDHFDSCICVIQILNYSIIWYFCDFWAIPGIRSSETAEFFYLRLGVRNRVTYFGSGIPHHSESLNPDAIRQKDAVKPQTLLAWCQDSQSVLDKSVRRAAQAFLPYTKCEVCIVYLCGVCYIFTVSSQLCSRARTFIYLHERARVYNYYSSIYYTVQNRWFAETRTMHNTRPPLFGEPAVHGILLFS